MQIRIRLILSGLVLLLLLGCSLSSLLVDTGLSKIYREFDAPAATAAMRETLAIGGVTPENSPETETPEIVNLVSTTVPCAYVWDTQPLVEESAQLKVAFQDHGLGRAEVWATAYGERCVNLDTNSTVGGFLIIQTDFHVRMAVQDHQDEEALGRLLGQITQTLVDIPGESFPGTQTGSVAVEFSQDGQIQNFWFPLAQAELFYEQGLRDAALYQALRALK
jgi:hypothetical protein